MYIKLPMDEGEEEKTDLYWVNENVESGREGEEEMTDIHQPGVRELQLLRNARLDRGGILEN